MMPDACFMMTSMRSFMTFSTLVMTSSCFQRSQFLLATSGTYMMKREWLPMSLSWDFQLTWNCSRNGLVRSTRWDSRHLIPQLSSPHFTQFPELSGNSLEELTLSKKIRILVTAKPTLSITHPTKTRKLTRFLTPSKKVLRLKDSKIRTFLTANFPFLRGMSQQLRPILNCLNSAMKMNKKTATKKPRN